MGCYDTIIFKKEKHCPHCGALTRKDFQTKSLVSTLAEYKEGVKLPKRVRDRMIETDAFAVSDAGYGKIEAHTICTKCGAYVSINVWLDKWKITTR